MTEFTVTVAFPPMSKQVHRALSERHAVTRTANSSTLTVTVTSGSPGGAVEDVASMLSDGPAARSMHVSETHGSGDWEAHRHDGSSSSCSALQEWMDGGDYRPPAVSTRDIIDFTSRDGSVTARPEQWIIAGIPTSPGGSFNVVW